MKYTAGLWVYKIDREGLKILLVHPGGPFFSKKDSNVWSIPKGEYDPKTEDAFEVAKREFNEETGNTITSESFIELSTVKSRGGKMIKSWATEADFNPCFISSNYFEMEWPPKSGKMQSFPETDKAEWFNTDEVRQKINLSQLPIFEELLQKLNAS